MKLTPKFFGILRDRKKDLSAKQIKNDVIAGIIVAVVALPLSVALAISSGVTPDKGLVTAIIAGFLISFLGGSRVQIGGPTGAFVVIISGIIAKYGLDGLLISTLMAGVLLIIMGLMNFGSLLKYIPFPTTTGFTAGIAVVLLSTQVKDFFGLNISEVPSDFLLKWKSYIENFGTINITTALIGIAAIIIMILWPKINKTIPGSLIALILLTAIVKVFNLPTETIGSRFGDIPGTIKLIDFSKLSLSFEKVKELISPSITIALLAGIESLLSAVVADGMIGKKHNSNMELVAQGVANLGSALFGGIPATGAIARTAANVKNGGRTPIAGMVHALVLLLIMFIFMPLAKLIPMTVLSAILVIVSINMCDFKAIKAILNSTKSDAAVLSITFLLTVIFDLVVAIEFGVILAMFLFVRKMTLTNPLNRKEIDLELKDDNGEIAYFEMEGPFFYGQVNSFANTIESLNTNIKTVILNMNRIPAFDVTVLRSMRELNDRLRAKNISIVFIDVNKKIKGIMDKTGFTLRVGEDNFYDNLFQYLNKSNNQEILKNLD